MEQNAFQWPALPLPKLSPRFRLAFLTACLVGFLTHLYLFTNTLLNHDSIHSLFTDNNVLSSGRWSAQLLSSFSTFFQMPVVIGLISILALAVTAGLRASGWPPPCWSPSPPCPASSPTSSPPTPTVWPSSSTPWRSGAPNATAGAGRPLLS